MTRQTARFFLLALVSLVALGALLGGCNDIPHQNVAMRGNADGVMINYVGEVADTLPIARQHCAQYERVPVLRQAKDNNATYACVHINAPPGAAS
jgi:hypothetical protein